MTYQSQIELLSHLLHKPIPDIQDEALVLFVEHLDARKRTAYRDFVEAAEADEAEPRTGDGGPGYTLADGVSRMQLNLNTIKGRILNELRSVKHFTRTDFTTAVAKAMRWDAARRQFGIDSKFPDLATADKGWWGTLKGKEKLVTPRP